MFAALLLVVATQARAAQTTVEAETMARSGSSVVVHSASAASGGKDVAFYSNGSASKAFDGAAIEVVLRARGTACNGSPQFKVYVDGVLKGTVDLTSSAFADYTLALDGLSGGSHTLRVSHENDLSNGTCDRNAYLDYYVLSDSPPPPPPPEDSPVLVGAGDIASCSSSGDSATAALLDSIPGTVFTAGDNAYDHGTEGEFANCYDPTWGRHKARTMPTPGNHEYQTLGASGYFGYFGAAAGDPAKGYYSYDLGEWHVVALNSMCEQVGGCGPDSPMVSWLEADLRASTKACTAAIWHHPLFSSGPHGNDPKMRPSWEALYAANADVVLNGHEHNYERFAPQDPSGTADPEGGIREFVVGTGGAERYSFLNIQPNSQVRNANTFGVLKLTLYSGGYDWQFVPEAGKTFTDSGRGQCHAKAGGADTTPPTIGSVAPSDGATDVAVTANAEATFSEAMDATTIDASTFTLTEQGTATPIDAAVSYDGASKTATLDPSADLKMSTTYNVTAKGGTGGVKDAAGNPMATDKVWSFTTAGPPDTTAPETTIESGPAGTVNSGSAAFRFSSSEAGSTFECRLDNAAFGSCSSPKQYADLADGPHVFEVRATDTSRNTDPTPASRTWTVASPFSDTFTGGDGAAWDKTKWTSLVSSGGRATVDLRSDAGRMRFENASGAQAFAIASMPKQADAEALTSFRFPSNSPRGYMYVFLRASGDWVGGVPTSSYFLQVQNDSGSVSLWKSSSGGAVTQLGASKNVGQATTTKQWARFRVQGSSLQAKVWTDGTPEPQAWEIETTDTTHAGPGVLQLKWLRSSAATAAQEVYFDELRVTAP